MSLLYIWENGNFWDQIASQQCSRNSNFWLPTSCFFTTPHYSLPCDTLSSCIFRHEEMQHGSFYLKSPPVHFIISLIQLHTHSSSTGTQMQTSRNHTVTQKTTVKRVHADPTTKGSSGLKYCYNHKGFQMLCSLLLGTRASCCWLMYALKMLSRAALRESLVAQTVKHLPAMWETRVQSLGREDPLEKEMATHSTILAWKIPWMKEPGRL